MRTPKPIDGVPAFRFTGSPRYLAALVSLGIVACHVPPPEPLGTQIVKFESCPEHSIALSVGQQVSVDSFRVDDTVTNIPLASEIDEIPEYHDCQRFIVGGQFGPLVAVWASQRLNEAFNAVPDGVPVAVAVLVSSGRYEPLGIGMGFNCLYMWQDQYPNGRWAATIEHIGVDPGACIRYSERPLATGRRLDVWRHPTPVGLGHEDIPPVARFARSTHGSKPQLIGIRCADAWCEVRPQDSPSRRLDEALPPDAITSQPKGIYAEHFRASDSVRVTAIPGWYDVQELAIMRDGKLVPSGVIGRLIPNPGLDLVANPLSRVDPYLQKKTFENYWEPVGQIQVDQLYNGAQLQLQPGITKFAICKLSTTSSNDCLRDTPDSVRNKCIPDATGARWLQRATHPNHHVSYRCIKMTDHGTGKVIPVGAARWRWHEDDETTWFRCASGCCTEG